MRVINQGGFLHENISRIWVEENCRFIGRRLIFHRIWGHDEDRGYDFVLDWGVDIDQVREVAGYMQDHLKYGSMVTINCLAYPNRLIKQKEESA